MIISLGREKKVINLDLLTYDAYSSSKSIKFDVGVHGFTVWGFDPTSKGSMFHSRPWTAFGCVFTKKASISSGLFQNLEPNRQYDEVIKGQLPSLTRQSRNQIEY